jgi:hypothetical protein
MLSAYELNGRKDAILLSQSVKLADKLVHAWVGNNAVPYGQLDFSTNTPVLQVTNIAEAGTLTLEFGLLSQLTGDQKYARLAEGAVRAVMKNVGKLSISAQAVLIRLSSRKRLFPLYPLKVSIRNLESASDPMSCVVSLSGGRSNMGS